MKRAKISGGCILGIGVLLAACGGKEAEDSTTASIFGNSSPCASAPAVAGGRILPWPLYRTLTEDRFFSTDGTNFSAYGLEVSMEVIRADPLNGMGYTSRKNCSRAFVMQDGRKVYLENERLPGSHTIIAERSNNNYLLLSGTLGENQSQQTELVKLNVQTGLRQQFAVEATPLGGCNASLTAIPSPKGDFILLERQKSRSCGFEQPITDVRLSLLGADLKELTSPYTGESATGVFSSWLSETEYQIKDAERTLSFMVPAR